MSKISIDVTIDGNTQRVNFTCGDSPATQHTDFNDDFNNDFA